MSPNHATARKTDTQMVLNLAQCEWIPVKDIVIDERIQRPLNKRWCEKVIADGFDPEAFGTLEVSRRPNGQIVCLDGQHRHYMMVLMGYEDQQVPCMVHRRLSFAAEAKLFVGRNHHRTPQLIDRFLQRVNAEEPVAKAVKEIVTESSLTIGRSTQERMINAVGALEAVYLGDRRAGSGRNPKALRDVLWTVIAAWGAGSESFTGHVVEGIGRMYLRDDKLIDRKELAEKLAKQGSVARLVGRARMAKDTHGVTVVRAVSGVVTDLYNKGRRVNKLASWWTS